MSKCTLGNAIQYHFVAVLADPFSNLLITHFVYVRRLRSSANYYTTTEVLVDTDNSDSWVIARSDVPEYSSRVKTVFKHIFDFLSDQSSCVKKKNFLQPIMICWNAHTSPWRWSWLSGKHCNNFIIICFVASGLQFHWFLIIANVCCPNDGNYKICANELDKTCVAPALQSTILLSSASPSI